MARRGRPLGREYTVKIEVWITQRQSDELEALCEVYLGVKRTEVLRRALTEFIRLKTDTPARKAEFERALRELQRRPTGLRAIPGGADVARPEGQKER